MSDKATPKRQERLPRRESGRPLTEQQINAMSEIFPGFGPWYRSNYIWNKRLVQAEQAEATEEREASA